MTVQVQTVSRLQSLLDLYLGGYRSPVVDQTVGKLITLEVKQCRAEMQRLAARLSGYEQQYHMTPDEFYRRFRNGELGDDMDFVEWSIFWDMHQATEKRLAGLVKQVPFDKSQAYYWSPEWQTAEHEADEDIAAGRIRRFENVKDAIAYLHQSRTAQP